MLSINISELIWTIIDFFILFFLLRRFLFRPITQLMDKRKAELDSALESERSVNDALAEAEAEIEESKAGARAEADAELSASLRELAAEREQAVYDAGREAEKLREESTAAAVEEKRAALEALSEEAGTIADALLSKVGGGE